MDLVSSPTHLLNLQCQRSTGEPGDKASVDHPLSSQSIYTVTPVSTLHILETRTLGPTYHGSSYCKDGHVYLTAP